MVIGVRFENRLQRMEKRQGERFDDDVEKWISQGRYYDELSPQEQNRYDQYRRSLGGTDREKALCYINNLFNDLPPDAPLHFRLAKRTKPPTHEEMKERAKELEEIILEEQK